jgi:hypothetical protein
VVRVISAKYLPGYLFRATSAAITRVSGLSPVEIPGIENINVTEFVPGHMSYRAMMPRLLREVGWMVESDEFTEIEDPDPDNHDARQRQLINEIEEARKELEKKPEKKRFGLFSKKKYAEKKQWETYDDRIKGKAEELEKNSAEGKDDNIMFDVEAIKKEVADLAAQGLQVKELNSTLPPMVLHPPHLRATKSFDGSLVPSEQVESGRSSPSNSAVMADEAQHSPKHEEVEVRESIDIGGLGEDAGRMVLTFESDYQMPPPPPPKDPGVPSEIPTDTARAKSEPYVANRPALTSFKSMPAGHIDIEHNAWVDDDAVDFGEQEVKMTFE